MAAKTNGITIKPSERLAIDPRYTGVGCLRMKRTQRRWPFGVYPDSLIQRWTAFAQEIIADMRLRL